jgi:hypothetical protein
MVRLKTRNLHFQVLFPEAELMGKRTKVSPFIRPCPGNVQAGSILALVRSQLQINFGDYGLGLVASTLAGEALLYR